LACKIFILEKKKLNIVQKKRGMKPIKEEDFFKSIGVVLEVAGYGVRTHAHLCAEDLKSSPLTTRANQLLIFGILHKMVFINDS
jgi:hypothetical protein